MSKKNNRRLRAQVRALTAKVAALDEECTILVTCCRCAYCDEILLSQREELLAHAKVCPKHPCRELEQRLAQREEGFIALLDKLNALGVWWLHGNRLVVDGRDVTGFTTAPNGTTRVDG